MNTNITIRRTLAVFLSLCLLLPGTAFANGGKGKKNFNEGKKYEATQQWDLAAQAYALAVSAEPNNPEYRLNYLRALQQASLMYVKRGDALAEQNDFAGAYTAYRTAFQYDQGNEVARIKMERMLDQQKAVASGFEPVPITNSGNAKPPSIVQVKDTPRDRDALTYVNFNSKFKTVAKTLGKSLGLNVIFDKDVKDDPVDIELTDTTQARAFDHVMMMTKHTFEQLDRRTIIVYQDNATNKPRFEKLFVKPFYLGNINAQQAQRAIQLVLGQGRQIQPLDQGGGGPGGGGGGNVLLVKATPQELQLVQDVLSMLDKNKNEVVLDVEIYEVSHDSMTQIGNQIATEGRSTNEIEYIDKSTGKPFYKSATTTSLGALGGFGTKGLLPAGTNIGSLVAGFGSVGAAGFLIGLPPTTLSLLQSKGNSRLLHKTQIHVLDGQQNVTKVGRSVPVRTGTNYGLGGFGSPFGGGGGFGNQGGIGGQIPGGGIGGNVGIGGFNQGGFGGSGGFGGIDNIQYKDVGLVIDAKPTITNEGYVEVVMKFETSDVLASGSDVNLTPTFTQRSLNTTARIKDGITAVVAGVNQETKGDSRAGIPILGMVPILGRLFSTPRQTASQSDIVITVTPHIIRSAGISEKDYLAIKAGNANVGQGGGLAPSIEDVIYRAQMEDEQERRLIALEQGGQRQPTSLTPDNQIAGAQRPTAPAIAPQQPAVQNTSNNNAGAPAKRTMSNNDLIPVKSTGSSSSPNNPVYEQQPVQPDPLNGGGGVIGNPVNGQNGTGEPGKEKDPKEIEKELLEAGSVQNENPVPVAVVRMGVETEEVRKKREQIRKDWEAQQKREAEEAKALKNKPATAPAPLPAELAMGPKGKVERALPSALNSVRNKINFSISPAPARQQMGKTFSLTVEASGQGEMMGATLALKFDEKKLQVKTVRGGELFGQQPELTYDAKKGTLKIAIKNAQKTPVGANGQVVVIEFVALSEGQTEIAFNNSDTKINLADNKSAAAFGSAAQVVITRDAVATSNQ